MLEEPGVDLHLAGQHGGHVVPGRDLVVPLRHFGVGRERHRAASRARGVVRQIVLVGEKLPTCRVRYAF
jgi:hypothetical protein